MSGDKITLNLEGDIPLDAFAEGLRLLSQLVAAAAKESGAQGAEWIIDDLIYSSAVATVRGYADEMAPVELTIGRAERVIEAVSEEETDGFAPALLTPARRLTQLVGGRVIALHLGTSDDFEVSFHKPRTAVEPTQLYTQAWGEVRGRIENLFGRSNRFMLMDSITRRPVSCHLGSGDQEMMRGIWRREAAVSGWVTREARSGRPVVVQDIRTIVPLDDFRPGQFRIARGALRPEPGEPSPEELIRKIRDGS